MGTRGSIWVMVGETNETQDVASRNVAWIRRKSSDGNLPSGAAGGSHVETTELIESSRTRRGGLHERGGRMSGRGRRGTVCQAKLVIAALALLSLPIASDGAGAVKYWECTPDGSLGASDLETQSCAFEKNVNSPCQSCISSLQSGTTSSGLLIPSDSFKCMKSEFTIPPEPNSARPPLCPGTYTVNSCETKEAVFEERVLLVKNTVDTARADVASCFDNDGIRKLEGRCTEGFPKEIAIEYASSLEFDSFLVQGRNPASYRKQYITSCPELVDLLSNTLVGCASSTAVGLVSPVSPETWCQTLTWRPHNDVYHPVNAQLPDAAATGGSAADGVGTGVVPIGTDLGYTQ